MPRTKKTTQFRLVTPPHMDVTIPFPSQEEALTEAKKRGRFHRTMLLAEGQEEEWRLLYDSAEDEEVDMQRRVHEEQNLAHGGDPATSTMLRRIMGRNPIDYFKRLPDGRGMVLTSIFITEDEDELPFIRAILMSDDFVCWPLPGYTEKQYIKRLAPYGNNAEYLFREPERLLSLNFQ